jgi:D-alanine-D-alanine ligase-like ATP-grasp enzyme
MRVCVLYDDETDGFSPAEFLAQYPCEWEMVMLARPVRPKIEAIAAQKRFDIYFNLCDGSVYENYPGLDVVEALEELNLPFTGSDSKFYDPTREQMQAVAEANGVGFARGHRVNLEQDLDQQIADLTYPLMVKHPQSYASTGMTRDSRVEDSDELHTQFRRIAAEFGSARVEEFIIGREFNVLVVDNPENLDQPIVYPPTELIFPPNEDFWHTAVKWDYSLPFEFRKVEDSGLAARLQAAGRSLYRGIGGTGYGRCDIRVKADGSLFVLEINANAGILYKPEEYGPADYMILYDKDGYYGFFDRIFRSAILRRELRSAAKHGAPHPEGTPRT